MVKSKLSPGCNGRLVSPHACRCKKTGWRGCYLADDETSTRGDLAVLCEPALRQLSRIHFDHERLGRWPGLLLVTTVLLWAVFTQSVSAQIFSDATHEAVTASATRKLQLAARSMPDEIEEESDEDWESEEDDGRSFLFKELVLSGFYSFDGVTGLPEGDTSKDYLGFSPRPPGNYIGLDYVRTFTSSSSVTQVLPKWLPLTSMDLHPRLLYDPRERNRNSIKFAPQDFWFRFNPGEVDRLMLHVGQFVIPYGVNPLLAPRQRFILPLEATDLGLKWDWGLDLKGPIGDYDWEIATTIGSGEGLHSPHLFSGSDRTSYLITGRIGSPAYWDFQNGLSFLYGDLPVIMGPTVFSDAAISRWRLGYDAFYKYGTYLMAGAQMTFGQDGFAGDERFVGISMGRRADVLGARGWVDWVIPRYQDVRLQFQYESVWRDLSTAGARDAAVIFQAGYSFTTSITTMLSFRKELNRSMGEKNDALYLTFIYYSL